MTIQSTMTMIEKIESVRICYRGEPMLVDWNNFTTYVEAYESLKANLQPGEWSDYAIVVKKSVERIYQFKEVA